MQLPEYKYTIVQLRVQTIIVFFLSGFFTLGLGTELMDVTSAYFGITLSPRQALVIVALTYGFIVIILTLSEIMPANEGGGKVIIMVTYIFLVIVFVVLYEIFPKFFNLPPSEQMDMERRTNIMVGLIVLSSSSLAAAKYYDYNKKNLESSKS